MEAFPDELLVEIISHLIISEVFYFTSTNRRLHQLLDMKGRPNFRSYPLSQFRWLPFSSAWNDKYRNMVLKNSTLPYMLDNGNDLTFNICLKNYGQDISHLIKQRLFRAAKIPTSKRPEYLVRNYQALTGMEITKDDRIWNYLCHPHLVRIFLKLDVKFSLEVAIELLMLQGSIKTLDMLLAEGLHRGIKTVILNMVARDSE